MVSSISGISSSMYVSQLIGGTSLTTTNTATTNTDFNLSGAVTAAENLLSLGNIDLSPEILSLLQEATSSNPLAALLNMNSKSDNQSMISQLLG